MNNKKRYLGLVSIMYYSVNPSIAAEIDYFSLSPAELAATPITIATGTPNAMSHSAAVTSIITAEQIKAMGATELHEVLETVPGFHASVQSGIYDYSYSVRGIRNATNSQLLMMMNGSRLNLPFRGSTMTHFELPLEAVERIEVIRGPGSALYGADAFAGVINIITKKADDINGTRLGMRAGDANTQSGFAQHSTHWADWDIASSLQYQHTDGDGDRMIYSDFQTTKDKAFGTNASIAPNKYQGHYQTLDAHLNLQRKHWDIDFWSFTSINSGLRAGVNSVLDPEGSSDGQQFLTDVRFSTEDWLKDLELSTHLSYLYADFSANFQIFTNNAELPINRDGNISNSLNANLPRTLFPQGVHNSLGRIENMPSIELGAIYKGWDKHLWRFITSFRYEQITTKEARNFGSGIVNGLAPPKVIGNTLTDITNSSYVYLPNTNRSVWSLVLQDEWQFAKDWQLTAGIRYDNYSDFGSTVNPRLALVWDVNEQLTTKLLYGKAFRAPSFSEQFNQNNPVLLGNKDLKPETINSIEWAVDYCPIDSLRTALNLYFYDIKNQIIAVPDVGKSSATFQNSGNQQGFGSEFEWQWQLAEDWRFSGNYAWQNARNQQTHRRMAYVPEHHVYALLDWQFTPNWHIQPQINWIGGRVAPVSDTRNLSDFETIDMTLRGKDLFGHLNVAASVRNVLNAHNNFEPAATTLPQNIPWSSRMFYFEASVKF
ncbi:Colicin I receptor [Patescibacteria group bacterium]|nr:Colicin I receptor [Patescibacteria group bacterium]